MIVFDTVDLPVAAALVQDEHEESVLLLQSGLSPAQAVEALRLVLRDVD